MLIRYMMTPSNGNIFCVTGSLWGESTDHRWIPPHKGVWRGVLMFSVICLNKRLSKQSRRRWIETPLHSSWRHCNEIGLLKSIQNCCIKEWIQIKIYEWTIHNSLEKCITVYYVANDNDFRLVVLVAWWPDNTRRVHSVKTIIGNTP